MLQIVWNKLCHKLYHKQCHKLCHKLSANAASKLQTAIVRLLASCFGSSYCCPLDSLSNSHSSITVCSAWSKYVTGCTCKKIRIQDKYKCKYKCKYKYRCKCKYRCKYRYTYKFQESLINQCQWSKYVAGCSCRKNTVAKCSFIAKTAN